MNLEMLAVEAAKPFFLPERPDVIYAAIVGGGISMLTAYLTNRNARKRQDLELKHQAEQKELERRHALKRDLYLPLVEALSSASAFVGGFSTASQEVINAMEPIHQLANQIARMSLIAPQPLMEKIHGIQKRILISVIRLFHGRIDIAKAVADIQYVDTMIAFYHPQPNSQNAQTVEGVSQEIQRLTDLKKGLIRTKFSLDLALSRAAIKEVKSTTQLSIEALLVIRRELDMPIDPNWLSTFMNGNAEEVFDEAKRFQDGVEKKVLGDLSKGSKD